MRGLFYAKIRNANIFLTPSGAACLECPSASRWPQSKNCHKTKRSSL